MRVNYIQPSRRRAQQSGFSLVELLVVVAIIVVLLSLLLPAIKGGKHQAQFITCQNNLRQMIGTLPLFATDNSGRLPGPNWGRGGKGWLYSNGKMDSLEDLYTGQMWPYLGNVEAYRCPSDPSPRTLYDIPNRPRNSRAITSYGTNGSWIAYGGKGSQANTYLLSQFRDDDILMWEGDETVTALGAWWDGSNYPHEGMSKRHVDRASVGCADGRVEWLYHDDYVVLYKENGDRRNSRVNRMWNVPSPPQP